MASSYEQMIDALADRCEAILDAESARQTAARAEEEQTGEATGKTWRTTGTGTADIVYRICAGKSAGVAADVEAEILARRNRPANTTT